MTDSEVAHVMLCDSTHSSLTSEPRWLRSKFFKLRDPNFSEVRPWIHAHWIWHIFLSRACWYDPSHAHISIPSIV
jgi:hypothetical protein